MKTKKFFLSILTVFFVFIALTVPANAVGTVCDMSLDTSIKAFHRGNKIEVTISLQNVSDSSGIAGISIDSIDYDSTMLTFESISATSLPTGWALYGTKAPFLIADDSGSNPVKAGLCISLFFKVNENAKFQTTTISARGSATNGLLDDVAISFGEVSVSIVRDHNFVRQSTEPKYMKSAATCTQKAVYYYSCVCGEKGAATFEYGTFASHNYGSWIPEVSATCTKAGTKGHYECSVCHKYFDTEKKEVNDLTLSKLSHTYNQKKADAKYAKSAATCTQKAVYYYSCICGEKGAATFEYGELAAHTYKAEWSSDKTNHWHECSACGNKKEQAAHADGNKDHKCDICGIRMSECADANKDHKCDICGKKLSDHTGGTATCKEKATCTLCGQKYGEFASHTLKSNEAVSATCKSKGNIAYWTCTVCDKYFSDSAAATEISKDAISTPFNSENHMGGVRLENKKEPTCGTDGYTGDTYCNGCDAKLVGGEVIKATGNHIFKSEWSNDDTRHWHDCTVCGNAKSDMSEHEDGNKDHTCDICGAKYSNHTGGTATCTEKAICAICGEKYGDFARHSWSEWKTDADGKRTKECSACGKVANFMYGDFNYDGKVNTIDLTIMRKYLAGYDVEFDTAAADFNGDGKVSTVDLTTLRKYLAGYDVVLDGNSQKMKSIYKAKAFSVGVGELLLRSLFAIGSRH